MSGRDGPRHRFVGTRSLRPVAAWRRWLSIAAAVSAGWSLLWLLAEALDVTVTRDGHAEAVLVGAVLAGATGAVALIPLSRFRPDLAADAVAVLTAVLLSGLLVLGLHGTAWGVGGLYADSSFRTEIVTRYAETAALADYAYADLPAYYPPAFGWLQGRAAALLGIAPWEALKPFQLLMAAVAPLVAYALWRRVLDPLPAAVLVAATSLVTADLHKPDEWLVLAAGVPWWLDAFRGVRAGGVRAWPPWRHGVVAGLLLLVHTYYFLPLAVATLLGLAVDRWRRQPPPLPPVRALLLVGVGLAVSSPYWLGLALGWVRGPPADDLQRRHWFDGAAMPPLPVSVAGALGLLGVAWLVWRRRQPLAAALGLLLVAGYATVLGGGVAAELGMPFLTFKSDVLIVSVQVAAGVLGLADAARSLWQHREGRAGLRSLPSAAGPAAVTIGLVALVVPTVLETARTWGTGAEVESAQTTRYPSGEWPAGWDGREPVYNPAFVALGDPSVAQLRAAWEQVAGRPLDSSTVVVTSRVDLLATTPLHLFVAWKSIYSHPYGQFLDRLALLRQVAECSGSACAAELLRDNPYDSVDGLVLERDGSELVLPLLVDNFPDRSRYTEVRFPTGLLDGPRFASQVVGDAGQVVVVALR